MSKLPRLSGLEVIKALTKVGFEVKRYARHGALLRHPANGRRTVVPTSHPELDTGTLRKIISEAGLTREQFMELI